MSAAQKQQQSTTYTKKEKVFIVSLPWNNEIILRNHWNAQLVALTKALGPENVYVSIYENGSYDNTKDALRLLDEELGAAGIRRKIVLDETSHAEMISKHPTSSGWIKTPKGDTELRRIPYLSRIRNTSLKPLMDLAEGEHFDKILFLNDIIFSTDDALNLLDTKDGEYAAACALDFVSPPTFYDTFALRDSEGFAALMPSWPYFRSSKSRSALKAGQPVPVSSCWNGMIAMDAAPFYDESNALGFRGIPDSLAQLHLEGSECCLIHADNRLSRTAGVWVNPNVRVGYCQKLYHVEPEKYRALCNLAYDEVNARTPWVGLWSVWWGSWQNRLLRWTTMPLLQNHVVVGRLNAWMYGEQRIEKGDFCLIDEMQVVRDIGWAHV